MHELERILERQIRELASRVFAFGRTPVAEPLGIVLLDALAEELVDLPHGFGRRLFLPQRSHISDDRPGEPLHY